ALTTGAFLAAWLFWVGLGSWGSRRALARLAVRDPDRVPARAWRALRWTVLAWIPALAVQVAGIRCLGPILGGDPAEILPLGRLLAALVPLCAPVSLVTGASFPLAAAASSSGRAGSRLYAWESLGCFVGGAGATLALLAGLSPLSVAGVAGLLLSLAVAVAARGPARRAAGLLALVCAALPLGAAGPLERASASLHVRRLLPEAHLLAVHDTARSRYVVARAEPQVVVLRDGTVTAAWPGLEAEIPAASLALVQAAGSSPLRVLTLGTLADERVRALLASPQVARVDLVVSDPEARELLAPWVPPATAAVTRDPRVRVVSGDARRFVARSIEGAWDLALLLEGAPLDAASGRLHTLEFHRLVRRALSDRGVVCVPVPTGAAVIGPEIAAQGASVVATLEAAFQEVVVLPGVAPMACASPSEGVVSDDPEVLAARWATVAPPDGLRAEAFTTLVDPTRLALVHEAFYRPDPAGGSAIDRDRRPRAWFLALLVQAREAGGRWTRLLGTARSLGAGIVGVPLLVLLVLGVLRTLAPRVPRERADTRLAGLLLAGGGFTALGLALLVLLAFQFRVGTLFGHVGLLNALLLGGTAAGAGLGSRVFRRIPSGPVPVAPLAVCGLTAAASLLGAALLPHLPDGHAAAPVLLAAAALGGLLAGAAFPAASTLSAPGTAGLLFAADHAGGAGAAVVVGLIVVPLLGLDGGLLLLAALQGVLAVLLLTRALREARPARAPRPLGFPWPRLGDALLAATLVFAGWSAIAVQPAGEPRGDLPPEVLVPSGATVRWESRHTPFPHYVGLNADGAVAARAANSLAVAGDVSGWAGPLEMLVEVGSDGRYRRLRILSSQETPSYLSRVEPALSALEGREAGVRLATVPDGGDVDAVSGATVTLQAALATVNATGAALAGGSSPGRGPRPAWRILAWTAFAPMAGLLALRRRRLRDAFLLLVVAAAVLGVAPQLSLDVLAGPLAGRFPSLLTPPGALIGVVGTLCLLTGATWCGVLCPFGAIQEVLSRLGLHVRVGP
ncbi:MAG: FMN-binding protein, partial [Deltaproteobacteria bacterium]|nr:FMN-binding protein [Deltaproteobacteria bacterium]